MIVTVVLILLIAAFVVTILNAMTPPRIPLWVAVLLLCIVGLLLQLPRGG